jgi:hypothetical protein
VKTLSGFHVKRGVEIWVVWLRRDGKRSPNTNTANFLREPGSRGEKESNQPF